MNLFQGLTASTYSRVETTFIEGQPYTFYRIYGAGGVSLYYIGKASDHAAMVAVVSSSL